MALSPKRGRASVVSRLWQFTDMIQIKMETGTTSDGGLNSSGSFAIFAAIRRASSRVSTHYWRLTRDE
jgi:hypothetical protein